jgi:hypothetical protein
MYVGVYMYIYIYIYIYTYIHIVSQYIYIYIYIHTYISSVNVLGKMGKLPRVRLYICVYQYMLMCGCI